MWRKTERETEVETEKQRISEKENKWSKPQTLSERSKLVQKDYKSRQGCFGHYAPVGISEAQKCDYNH